jgi:hypothetical protein
MSKKVHTRFLYSCDICGRILPNNAELSYGPTELNPRHYEVTVFKYYADREVMDSCESCQRALEEFIKSRRILRRNSALGTP